MIASNSRAHTVEYGGNWGEKEGDADYGGMVQPSQKNGAEWELGTRGLRIVAAFRVGIPVFSA